MRRASAAFCAASAGGGAGGWAARSESVRERRPKAGARNLDGKREFSIEIGADREQLSAIYRKEAVDDNDIDDVLDILRRWNVRYFAQGLAEDHRARAMGALSQTHIFEPSWRRGFDDLASFVLARDY